MAAEPQDNPGAPRFWPGDRLIAMFRACSRDPSQALDERLRRMLHTFLQHNRDDAANRKTKELCCCEAEIWYYSILENLVSLEKKRLDITDISGLLEDNLVQCCLVTCCLEITICLTHLQFDFPLLLHIFNLAPYHFWRVIELVLRTEVGLPCAVVRHLITLEKKVLESLAWTNDSPLWEDIRANEGHLPTCQQVIPPSQLEDPKRTEVKQDRNLPGVGVSLGAGIPTSTEQQCSSSAVNRPRRSSSFHLFTRKVYSLMGKRLRELCFILEISDELRLKIWTCFEHSLLHCTCLMLNRHLDQLLMCAIYIIAKITNMEIPFKRIMKHYTAQRQLTADNSVCKDVLISGSDVDNSPAEKPMEITGNGERSVGPLTPSTPSTYYSVPGKEQRGNLIQFYNEVYTAKMEDFAKQFASTSGGYTPPLSPYPQWLKGSSRRHRLSTSCPIFISLYKPETTPPLTTGLCYYFNSTPSERLREINNMIKRGRSPSRRSHAGDSSPSGKRPRLDDQSALQRLLLRIVRDRSRRRDQEQLSPVGKPDQC